MASTSTADDTTAELEAAIAETVLTQAGERAWQIGWRAGVGRVLVATRFLPRDAAVFRERPLVAAGTGGPTRWIADPAELTAVASHTTYSGRGGDRRRVRAARRDGRRRV